MGLATEQWVLNNLFVSRIEALGLSALLNGSTSVRLGLSSSVGLGLAGGSVLEHFSLGRTLNSDSVQTCHFGLHTVPFTSG